MSQDSFIENILIKRMHYRFQMNNENFCFNIKIVNIQPKLIHDERYSVFDDQNSSYNTIAKRSRYFREG